MGETLGGRIRGGRTFARKFQLLLVPLVLASAATIATPAVALGATATGSGVTTYVVNPEKNEIDVTMTYTIKNTTKSTSKDVTCYEYFTCTQTTRWYYNGMEMLVDPAGGPVSLTSNGGKVSQTPYKGTDAPSSLRTLSVTYPKTWYGETRVVTGKYVIPAGLSAPSYRALKSYASVCAANAVWNEMDSFKVNIVLPAGFKVLDPGDLTRAVAADGTITLSRTTPRYGLQSCIEAVNPSGLESTAVTGGSAAFTVQSWPEDTAWKASVGGFVAADAPQIEALTGLALGKGPFTLSEAAAPEVAVSYSTDAGPIVRLPRNATEAQVMQAIAEEGYASTFAEPWMAAGLASYAAQSAGKSSDTCSPSSAQGLTNWRTVAIDSATSDRGVRDIQEQTACYIFTSWAKDAGHDRFVAALAAAARGDNPYADASTTAATAGTPITAKLLLDMIDERAMIPAGVADLDRAQSLLADSQVFSASDLSARSEARKQYHALATSAGAWSLPPVIRDAMTAWDFAKAKTAMDGATKILGFRDQAAKEVAGLKLDGTTLEQAFESAKTQADLDAVVALARSESEAAAKVAEAARVEGGDRTLLQSIGLIGTDVATPLGQAQTALAAVKPTEASASAQSVIDVINGSNDQGTLRAGIGTGIALVLLLLLAVAGFVLVRRRRRSAATLAVGTAAVSSTPVPQANVFDPGAMADFTPALPNSPEGPSPAGLPAVAEFGTAETQGPTDEALSGAAGDPPPGQP